MKDIKKGLKQFIVEKVKESTSEERPFFIVKWSGLYELTKSYGIDLLKLIDEMEQEGLIKKALLPTKKGKNKILAICLPERAKIGSKKAKMIMNEFQEFLKR
jgi:hypothetical protein